MSTARPMQASKSARVGVIGAGYFSQFHLRSWQQCGATVVAVCDADQSRAEEAVTRFAGASAYTDPKVMLARDDLDLIDIVVPPAHQFEVVDAAIERGLPIICQKPFLTSHHQAEAVAKRASTRGVPLVVHENFRFMPWYREAKRLIESGHLGALHSVLFRLRPGDGQGKDAYLDRQPYFQSMQRFLVAETAIHFVDTFRYLFGEVSAVTARLRRINPVIAGEDAGVVVFEFKSGAIGILDANRCNDHTAENTRRTMGEMWLEGGNGCLRLDGNGGLWWKPHGAREVVHDYDAGSTDPRDFGGGASTRLQASALRAFFENGTVENSAADYLTNIRIQEAIYQSHQTGLRIEIDTFSPPINPVIPVV